MYDNKRVYIDFLLWMKCLEDLFRSRLLCLARKGSLQLFVSYPGMICCRHLTPRLPKNRAKWVDPRGMHGAICSRQGRLARHTQTCVRYLCTTLDKNTRATSLRWPFVLLAKPVGRSLRLKNISLLFLLHQFSRILDSCSAVESSRSFTHSICVFSKPLVLQPLPYP